MPSPSGIAQRSATMLLPRVTSSLSKLTDSQPPALLIFYFLILESCFYDLQPINSSPLVSGRIQNTSPSRMYEFLFESWMS